jgi:hypothetical protein
MPGIECEPKLKMPRSPLAWHEMLPAVSMASSEEPELVEQDQSSVLLEVQ